MIIFKFIDAEECLARLNISVAKSSNSARSQATPNRGSFEGTHEEREKESFSLLTVNPRPARQALIEELQSTTAASCSSAEQSICSPEHSMAVVMQEESKKGGAARAIMNLMVKLPGVQSVRDVELEVSEVGTGLAHSSLNGDHFSSKTYRGASPGKPILLFT